MLRFLASNEDSSKPQSLQTGYGAHQVSYLMCTKDSFAEIKQPGCEADHLPGSTAIIKNAWIFTSHSSIHSHFMYRDIFTLPQSRMLAVRCEEVVLMEGLCFPSRHEALVQNSLFWVQETQ